MKKNILKVALVAAFGLIAGFNIYNAQKEELALSDLMMDNVEALASNESGSKCQNGCSDIGWGLSKILECDCNYDHFSSCNRWGC